MTLIFYQIFLAEEKVNKHAYKKQTEKKKKRLRHYKKKMSKPQDSILDYFILFLPMTA